MRVLLISENRNMNLVAPFPLGPAFVAGSLRRCGHEVVVLDFMFLEDWKERLRATFRDFHPDAVGLSIRNIDNQDMGSPVFFLPSLLGVVSEIRSHTNAPLILGGSGFNIHPEGCLRFLDADLGIYGEGEDAFPLLLDALAMQDGKFEKVPGAVWKKGDQIIINGLRYLSDPVQWASPAYSDFDVTAYHEFLGELPGSVTVQTKRGCHMECIYCSTPLLEGKHCRSRDMLSCVSEMASLNREKNIRRFYVVDNVFNFPISGAKNFCREIIAQGIKVNWQAILNPAFGDEELFELMGKSGCRFISLGNDSGHELILRNLRKGFTLANVRKAARLARANGIKYGCFLLFGGPGETQETVMQSIEFVDKLSPDIVTLKAGIRIYPGTQLEAIAREEGIIENGEDLLHPVFYLSPAIRGWIRDYMRKAVTNRENWKI
ncbi:MAG: B12-binding domain-containing radical SAM protein [Dissulfurispiraceae bacterium]